MDAFAHTMLAALPLVFAAKTGAFTTMAVMLARQDSVTLLGVYIVRMFAALAITSLLLTIIFAVFVWQFWDAELSGWLVLMAPLGAAVAMTAAYGIKIIQLEKRLR